MGSLSAAPREYGDQGWMGIATPQANPTVEAELRLLLPQHTLPLFTRSTSSSPVAMQRLRDYFDQLEGAVESFGGMPIDAVGFACTGSSYVVGLETEHRQVSQLEARFDLPVITATRAIAQELTLQGIRRLHIVAPYPKVLCDAALQYWSDFGIEVTRMQRMDLGTDDTRAIYDIRSHEVQSALSGVDTGAADAVLLSGTGMPTLTALARADMGVPLISSNLCLAAALMRAVSAWPQGEPVTLGRLIDLASVSVGFS